MRIADHPGARQAHAVDQRGVVERIGENRILRAGERGDGAEVRLIAGGKKQRPWHLHELGELRREALVAGAVPAQEMRGAFPDSVTRRGLDRRLHDSRMVREPEVVVAAEREDFLPVHDDSRPLRALANKAAATQTAPLELGKLLGEAVKDQEPTVPRQAAPVPPVVLGGPSGGAAPPARAGGKSYPGAGGGAPVP